MTEEDPKYLLASEVADEIRESVDQVRRRCNAGQIKATNLGGKWRIARVDLDAFMDAPRVRSPRRRLTKRQREQLGLMG